MVPVRERSFFGNQELRLTGLICRRGPEARALKPQDGAVMDLPAGGKVDFEIACQCVGCLVGQTRPPTDALAL